METTDIKLAEMAVGGGATTSEKFSYNDDIVRKFALATLVWGLFAFALGLYVALLLLVPSLSFGIEYLTLGRLRPLHTNAAIFAFAGNGLFAAVYYSTQRLCKARMWSDLLGSLHFWGWQLIILLAVITLPLGMTQGKEYAELEWPIDLLIAVVWILFFGVNFFMTLFRRRERHMYVALWFYIATIVTVSFLHLFNNLVVPVMAEGLTEGQTLNIKSYSVYAGVQDAFMQWWYGHNLIAFFLTIPFLGLMYYFLPKAADRPVYSYKLSILHFWSLVFIYIWSGPHHLHYTALPEWASTLGMIFSLMIWIPSWGGMINGLLTLRGAWSKVSTDPVLKFFVVAITVYGMSTFEGPLLSIKSVNALTHYSDWTIAHVHAATLGWNGFLIFGMLYWLLPRIFQTKLYSVKLATWHFWIGTIGIFLYIVPIYVAGITEGLMWRALDSKGGLVYGFMETLQTVIPMYWLRVGGGLLYIAGGLMFAYNYFMTWSTRPAKYEVPVYSAPKLSKEYLDPPAPVSNLTAVLEFAKKLDVWSGLGWHRRWEYLPTRFTSAVILLVVFASLLEMVPMFLIRANVPTIAKVTPYTPLELAGRDIYVAEGCYGCHSQMIRPILSEVKRFGEYSKPGEFTYDHPFQWGSRRVGPDLSREGGGRQSNLWHYQHFVRPQRSTEGSVMPSYNYLAKTKLNFKAIKDRVQAAQWLGAKYDFGLDEVEEHAKKQAQDVAGVLVQQGGPAAQHEMQIMALIAYVQRLGTDISRPDTPLASGDKP